jgi:hypothetical protein
MILAIFSHFLTFFLIFSRFLNLVQGLHVDKSLILVEFYHIQVK